MTPDSTASEEKGERSYWGFVIWPVVAVMVYVLSSGPALLLVSHNIIPENLLAIWQPLDVLSATPIGEAMETYWGWWLPHPDKRPTTP